MNVTRSIDKREQNNWERSLGALMVEEICFWAQLRFLRVRKVKSSEGDQGGSNGVMRMFALRPYGSAFIVAISK
jgi:hypothetical protein